MVDTKCCYVYRRMPLMPYRWTRHQYLTLMVGRVTSIIPLS